MAWLDTARTRTLIGLLVLTGIASLVLRAAFPDESWSAGAQTLLLLVFIAGAVVVLSGGMEKDSRQRLLFTAIPSLGAVAVGLLIPGMLRLSLGIAVGWLFAAQFLMRDTITQPEYKQAIRAMRKRNYDKAIEHITELTKREPNVAAHFGFRAQLHRLNNDLKQAETDYRRMMKLEPDSSVAPNGLAEISLQREDLPEARQWAELAYQKTPMDWVAVYNLGMIAERQQDDEAAAQYLNEALNLKMPDSRHRLLTRLWLARIYQRQGEEQKAAAMIDELRGEKKGLKEWQTILESEEAASLRAVLQQDVRMAAALMQGKSLVEVVNAAR